MADLILKDVRLSFPQLGEPDYYQSKKQRPDDERRWDAAFLIPYGSPQIAVVEAAILAVAKAKWEKKWEMVLENLRGDPKGFCFQDGKKKAYDGYAGHWALTSHRRESKGRPLVLDSDKSPIYLGKAASGAPGEGPNDLYKGKAGRVYGGCYVNAHVEIFAWDSTKNASKGIGCELLGIQRKRDGDAFTGGMAPDADAFDEITEGNNADDLT